MTVHGDRAVVLGGSMAGLLAARVLADAYAEVVVVERDALPGTPTHRRGVPQSRHIHGLLAGGQQALEELFAGFTAELAARGAPTGDMLRDVRVCFGGHWLRPGPSGLVAVQASRPLLETCLRDRVRSLPGVQLLESCDVVGPVATPDGGRVTGARVVPRRDESAEQTLKADLVVDATGRGSRAPVWLDRLGVTRPPEEQVRVDVRYASATFRLGREQLGGALGLIQAATPRHPRGGAVALTEGGQGIVTLYGMLGDRPPTDHRGFLAFANTLQHPDLADVLRSAEPLTEPAPFRIPMTVRRHYERLRRFPEGLLVLGDAACTFNPVYGQGMSVAALEALALRDHLRRRGTAQPSLFFSDVARIVDVPWAMATGGDLAFSGVAGRRSLGTRLLGGYLSALLGAAARDDDLGRAFVRVAGLVDPPQDLLQPRRVLRVAASRLRPARSSGVPSGAARPPVPG